jgi:hypothetical protein
MAPPLITILYCIDIHDWDIVQYVRNFANFATDSHSDFCPFYFAPTIVYLFLIWRSEESLGFSSLTSSFLQLQPC